MIYKNIIHDMYKQCTVYKRKYLHLYLRSPLIIVNKYAALAPMVCSAWYGPQSWVAGVCGGVAGMRGGHHDRMEGGRWRGSLCSPHLYN